MFNKEVFKVRTGQEDIQALKKELALLNKLKIYDKNINIIVCLKEFDS